MVESIDTAILGQVTQIASHVIPFSVDGAPATFHICTLLHNLALNKYLTYYNWKLESAISRVQRKAESE